MKQSLFYKYVLAFFPLLSTLIFKINGKREENLKYYHKDTNILDKVFSPDGKWESTSVNTTFVAADFVAMDSPLPIKDRDVIASANGKLPKLGISKTLKESEITTLNIMEAQGGNKARIRKKLADDPVACNVGLDELLEYAFLFGFSNGYVALPDEDNDKALLRLNYGYLKKNTFGTEVKGKLSLNDLYRVANYASEEDDNTVIKIWIAKSTYDYLRQTQEARQLVASYLGHTYDSDTLLPVPNSKTFQEAFEDETGATFEIVNRSVKFEKNGGRKSVKPWNPNRIIFSCNEKVGTLLYGQLAEATNKVEGVLYQLIDDFKLISKYSLTNPLREMTGGQAIAAPIIEDVDQIYVLDLTEAKSVEVDEEGEAEDTSDYVFIYNGVAYAKASVLAAYKSVTGKTLKSNTTDTTLAKKLNELSDEQEEAVIAASIKAYVVTFTANGGTSTKVYFAVGEKLSGSTRVPANTSGYHWNESELVATMPASNITVNEVQNS